MSPAMQQAMLRRACARLTDTLSLCTDLPAGELFMARMAMLPVLGMASRGPALALPWRPDIQPDHKSKAANDDTFKP